MISFEAILALSAVGLLSLLAATVALCIGVVVGRNGTR